VGVTLSMITVPEGKDPDELIKKDPGLWRQVIETHQYALDWLMARYAAQLDLTTALGKRQFSDVTLAVVRRLPDQVEQDHYLGEIARMSGISREALEQKLHTEPPQARSTLKKPKVEHKIDPVQVDRARVQDQLMALTLMQPALRQYLKPLTYDMLVNDSAHQLLRFLQDNPQFSGDPKEAEALSDVADYVKILSLQFDELYRQHELLDLRNEAAHLQAKLIKQYVHAKKQPITEALATATEPERTHLLEEAKALDTLLRKN
jgi:DNA primase